MIELVEQFNEFFREDGHMVINKTDLEITIGTKILTIQFPTVIGGKSTAPLSTS